MIVQPDFFDHWKTKMLIGILDDPCAPMYVMRLWAHCQNRKTHRFPRSNPNILKAICHAQCDGVTFEKSMLESGYLEIEGEEWVVHEWDAVNAYLVNSWENGKKGGRPRKQTHGIPEENPRDTHGNPIGNPQRTQTEPIREEKRREEKKSISPLPPSGGVSSPGKRWTKAGLARERYEDYPNFQAWWSFYPNSTGKRKAFEAWVSRGLEAEDQERIARVLEVHCREWEKDGGAFVPHGSTYLNQRRDEDEPEELARSLKRVENSEKPPEEKIMRFQAG
jgi:hypothetical protein